MNENEAKDCLNKVLESDKLVHEQQLGIHWEPPNTLVFVTFLF